jgi:hypothetical protein
MGEERVNTGGTINFVYPHNYNPQLKPKDKKVIEDYYKNMELEQERQEVLRYKRVRKIGLFLGIIFVILALFSIIKLLVWLMK